MFQTDKTCNQLKFDTSSDMKSENFVEIRLTDQELQVVVGGSIPGGGGAGTSSGR